MKNLILLTYILFCFKAYGIDPKKEYITTPSKIGLKYVSERIKVNDLEINTWLTYSKFNNKLSKKHKTIFLVYGDYGNMSYFINYIDFFSNLGYNVISFDYRGFGESSNFEINKNQLYYNEFADDFNVVLNYYQSKIGVKNLTIMSLSMGSITTVIGLVKNNKSCIYDLIFEGAVYDDYEILQRLKEIKGKVISSPNNKDELKKKWNYLKSNIIIVVGEEDLITNKEDANIIVSKGENRKLIILQGGHLSSLHNKSNINIFSKLFKK